MAVVGLRIRPALAGDAPALVPLLAVLGHPAPEQEIAARLETLLPLTDRERVLVAEEDGRVTGVAALHGSWPLHRARPVARLTVLAVAPEARGRGVGRALVAAAEVAARGWGAGRIELTSGADRAAAHAFYRGLGYRQEGVKLARDLDRHAAVD